MKRAMVACALIYVGAVLVGCAGSTGETDSENSASADLSGAACTSTFGSGLSGQDGRLDGTVSAVVAPQRSHQCNGDTDHVHVQITMQGAVYDVAVNTNGIAMIEKDVTSVPGGAWADGWHKGATVSYASDVGIHSGDFGATTDVSQQFLSAVQVGAKVSAYGWLYSHGGIHLIHKSRSSNADGALVVQGTSGAKLYAFKFDNQSF